MSDTIASIFGDFLIAILAAVLTYLFAVIKFRSERWWDLKVIAYQRIIEALHKSKDYSSQHYDVALGIKELSVEKENYLKEGTLNATQEIAKAIDVGTFLISAEALDKLEIYNKALTSLPNKTNSWFEYLDESYGLTKDCLEEIKRLAKQDLKRTRL